MREGPFPESLRFGSHEALDVGFAVDDGEGFRVGVDVGQLGVDQCTTPTDPPAETGVDVDLAGIVVDAWHRPVGSEVGQGLERDAVTLAGPTVVTGTVPWWSQNPIDCPVGEFGPRVEGDRRAHAVHEERVGMGLDERGEGMGAEARRDRCQCSGRGDREAS